MKSTTPQPRRQQVLIVWHPDGYLEAFAEKNIDVRISRVPVAHSREAERIAEDLLHQSLPPYWRKLHWPNKRRATATLTPLLPSTLATAKATKRAINELNKLAAEFPQAIATQATVAAKLDRERGAA